MKEACTWPVDALRAILVLNAIDAILTVLWIQLGFASEANPILAELAHGEPVVFVATKLALVSLGVLLLVRHTARRFARAAVGGGLLAYSAVFAFHLSFVVRLA
ncbi:MAG: DUF5658 family protein [Deltaproteobacteria bacterium]